MIVDEELLNEVSNEVHTFISTGMLLQNTLTKLLKFLQETNVILNTH